MAGIAMIMSAAVAAALVQAAPAPPVALQPPLDSVPSRQAMRSMVACIAEARPRWARNTLNQPYLSSGQASVAAEMLMGRDRCIRSLEAEMTFRTSTVVAGLAEHFLQADGPRLGLSRLTQALATATPLNTSEDFGLCVAAADPAAAYALALSDPGSATETASADRLGRHFVQCTNQGERLTVDLQSLRALTATALYRAATVPTVAAR